MIIGKVNTLQQKVGDSKSIELRNGVVLGGLTLTGIVAAITSLVTLWFIDIPGYNQNRKISDQVFQMEVLDHCLRLTDSVHRKNSIKVLIVAGILNDKDGQLNDLIEGSFEFPSWKELDKFQTSVHKFSGHNGKGNSDSGGNDSLPKPSNPIVGNK